MYRSGSSTVARIVLDGAGIWTIETDRGERHEARLVRGWIVAEAIAGIVWRSCDGRDFRAWLISSHYDQDVWRRLLVRLRIPN
jgi:hypothetical protein